MIIAGIGLSTTCTAEEIMTLVGQACAERDIERASIAMLATVADKASLPALSEAAAAAWGSHRRAARRPPQGGRRSLHHPLGTRGRTLWRPFRLRSRRPCGGTGWRGADRTSDREPSRHDRIGAGMTVHFIGAGPGAPDLITVRGRDLVARCRSVFMQAHWCERDCRAGPGGRADRRYGPAIPWRDHGRDRGGGGAGLDVARLHSGDLSIWSALGEQVRALDERGIAYTVTPGVPVFRCGGCPRSGANSPCRGLLSPLFLTAPQAAPAPCRSARDHRRFRWRPARRSRCTFPSMCLAM